MLGSRLTVPRSVALSHPLHHSPSVLPQAQIPVLRNEPCISALSLPGPSCQGKVPQPGQMWDRDHNGGSRTGQMTPQPEGGWGAAGHPHTFLALPKHQHQMNGDRQAQSTGEEGTCARAEPEFLGGWGGRSAQKGWARRASWVSHVEGT